MTFFRQFIIFKLFKKTGLTTDPLGKLENSDEKLCIKTIEIPIKKAFVRNISPQNGIMCCGVVQGDKTGIRVFQYGGKKFI
jgi:hypothetical protein